MRGGVAVDGGKEEVFVRSGFDSNSKSQFVAVFVVGLWVDTSQLQMRILHGHFIELQADFVIIAAIDHYDLKLMVLLCEQ